MKCRACNEDKLLSQVAHHTCTTCGESLALCFLCDHEKQAYAAVDAFRKEHVCIAERSRGFLCDDDIADHEATALQWKVRFNYQAIAPTGLSELIQRGCEADRQMSEEMRAEELRLIKADVSMDSIRQQYAEELSRVVDKDDEATP